MPARDSSCPHRASNLSMLVQGCSRRPISPAFNLSEAEEDPELRASQAALDELENDHSGVKMHYTKRQRLEKEARLAKEH